MLHSCSGFQICSFKINSHTASEYSHSLKLHLVKAPQSPSSALSAVTGAKKGTIRHLSQSEAAPLQWWSSGMVPKTSALQRCRKQVFLASHWIVWSWVVPKATAKNNTSHNVALNLSIPLTHNTCKNSDTNIRNCAAVIPNIQRPNPARGLPLTWGKHHLTTHKIRQQGCCPTVTALPCSNLTLAFLPG